MLFDYALAVWFASVVLSTGYVTWDTLTKNPATPVMRWG